MGESFTELKKPQRELLEQIKNLLSRKESVSRREIREHVGLGDHRLRDLLSDLVSLEYLSVVDGKQGKSFRYKLAEDIIVSDKIIEGLTRPEELAKKIEQAADNEPPCDDFAQNSPTSPDFARGCFVEK